MSVLIAKHCASLQQWKDEGKLHQVDEDMLIDLHTELARLQSTDPENFRRDFKTLVPLLCGKVLYLNNSILTFLLDQFIQLLKQWYRSGTFNHPEDSSTFETLSVIVSDSAYLDREVMISEFINCLIAIARRGKDLLTHPNITVITRLVIDYTMMYSNHGTQFMDTSPFDDAIIACLTAPNTTEIITGWKSSVRADDFSATENFLLNGLFAFASLMNKDQLLKNALDLRRHFLPPISDLLDDFAESMDEWTAPALTILTSLTTMFLYSVQMTVANDLHLDVQIRLCETSVRILLSRSQSSKLNNNCCQYIYMGTMNDKILDVLKSRHLSTTFFKLLELYKDENELQFNIYRILAAIMTEEDIKRLADPGNIARVFLEQLRTAKDLPGWETRVKNLLLSLKSKSALRALRLVTSLSSSTAA